MQLLGGYIAEKEGSGREEKGDAKDCLTRSDPAVTFQLPLKPHLTKKKKDN